MAKKEKEDKPTTEEEVEEEFVFEPLGVETEEIEDMVLDDLEELNMVIVDAPLPVRMTGSTGLAPLQDGGVRAAAVTIPALILGFLQIEYDILSIEGYAAAASAMVPGGILFWAGFDKFMKPRISSS